MRGKLDRAKAMFGPTLSVETGKDAPQHNPFESRGMTVTTRCMCNWGGRWIALPNQGYVRRRRINLKESKDKELQRGKS